MTIKGWRTMAFNALNAALAILAMPEIAAVIPAELLPYIMAFAAVGNMYLRSITNTPVGKAE